jgi:hypothetical protein
MTGGPERKYTDRDVRENPDFHLTVIHYLNDYEGEFDFLVDCKMRVAMERELTVGMVRGILNCMRHDPRVTGLPEPRYPTEGKVLQMPLPNKKQRSRIKDCDIEEFHGPHGRSIDPDYYVYHYCEGRYPINRSDFDKPAVIKVPFMMSKFGKLIHRVSQEPGDAWFMWRPNAHAWGWRYSHEGDPDLYVRTLCHYPRIIDNPVLFDSDNLNVAKMMRVGSSAHQHEYCKRCFAGRWNSA